MGGETFSEITKFSVLCNALEKIYTTTARNKKVEIANNLISSFRQQSRNHQNDNMFPILRLMIPQLDRERGAYGIKENTLANIYVRVLCLSKQSPDAQKLLSYKSPKGAGIAGDFAEVAFFIFRSRFSNNGCLTVYDVNQHLDSIAAKHASHDTRGIDIEIQKMLTEMSPLEQKWLIRMILKDTRLGLSPNKMLELFHKDANDLYDVTSDLKKICIMLKDPTVRLHEIEINIMSPFKPMLSQRCDIQNIEQDIKAADCYMVESKYDGERFQIHYQDGVFKYFSRRCFDYTYVYGADSNSGTLSPYLARSLQQNVKSCILDGEMMCWHTQYNRFITKGMNVDVKSLKVGDTLQPCYVAFDIVYLNGASLTNKPFHERVQILESTIKPYENVVMISSKRIVQDRKEVLPLLYRAIDDCEEGLLVKDSASAYKPNARNSGWYKIKPEYTKGIMAELDLLIVGGYLERRVLITHFLVAVADSNKNANGEPLMFYPISRIGSGCTRNELLELNNKLKNSWEQTIPDNVERCKETPHFWIKPSNSLILEIIATEVSPNGAFKSGFTLRFPRIQKVRYDKPWYDCLSLEEFHRIRESTGGKLCVNSILGFNQASAKSSAKRAKRTFSLGENFKPNVLPSRKVEPGMNIFENREICILSGYESLSKKDLEAKAFEFGAKIVQNPGPSTYCVISSDESNIRTKNVIRQGKFDVVRSGWLMRCIQKVRLIERKPRDFMTMCEETTRSIGDAYDKYGDRYDKLISGNELRSILDHMAHMNEDEIITSKQMIQFDRMLFAGENPFSYFRGCYAFFVSCEQTRNYEHMSNVFACKNAFKFFGGTESSSIDRQTTHLIYFSKGADTLDLKQNLLVNNNLKIVREDWIFESQKAAKKLDEYLFSL